MASARLVPEGQVAFGLKMAQFFLDVRNNNGNLSKHKKGTGPRTGLRIENKGDGNDARAKEMAYSLLALTLASAPEAADTS